MAKVPVDKELLEKCRAAWGYETYEETRRNIEKWRCEEDERLRRLRNGSGDEVIIAALDEHIRQRGRLKILDLFGKVEYYPDYDYKELRRKKRG